LNILHPEDAVSPRPSSPSPQPHGRTRRRSGLGVVLDVAPWLTLGAMILTARSRHRQSLAGPALNWLQPGRGRNARSPREIPARGWRDILWRTWQEFNKDQIASVSGGVAFFGLLALFPGFAAFVALYGLFADPQDAIKHVEALAVVAPRDAVVAVGTQMIRISEQRPSSLSVAFAVSLVLSIWSASSGVKSLFNGLNVAYGEHEKRSFVRLSLLSIVFILCGLAFLAVVVATLVVAPLVLPFMREESGWLDVARWPVLLASTVLMLALIYRFGPSREHARWQWITWGSALAALLWLAASLAFSWYMSNLAHYDRTYGSFGAAAGAMIWMWMSVIIVLLGAELNAEIEHQTAVDSTTGPPKPMGLRGAHMADTVGKAKL
jgi:membrane protein